MITITELQVFIRQKQFSGGHTHLYTEESLLHLCRELEFEIVSEWWFGTSIVDLFRFMSVNLESKNCSKTLSKHWKDVFTSIIDALQLELDKKNLSSEVHLLLKKI
jgi:hypothetical protein